MVTRSLAAVLVGCAIALTNVPTSYGADIKPQEFKVVGTWGNLSAWQVYEKPFWAEMLPKASGGKLTAQAIPITEAGLKGYEVVRLLQLNVFDFAHGLVGYVAKGNGLIEACRPCWDGTRLRDAAEDPHRLPGDARPNIPEDV